MVYLCIWGETMLFCFVSIYGSWTLESMEFSNSFKFEPTDPKQCAGSHSSHLSCHLSLCLTHRTARRMWWDNTWESALTMCYLLFLLFFGSQVRSSFPWETPLDLRSRNKKSLSLVPQHPCFLPFTCIAIARQFLYPKCSQELQDGKSGNIWILLSLFHHPAWSHCQRQHCCSLAQLYQSLRPHALQHTGFPVLHQGRTYRIGALLMCKMDTWMTGRLVGFFKLVMWYYLCTWWSWLWVYSSSFQCLVL